MLVTDRADHHCAVKAVAFSPDGTRVATASGNFRGGKARVFEVAPDALIQRATDLMSRSLNPAELRRYASPQEGDERWPARCYNHFGLK